jgi:hypothetical protein
MSIPKGFYDWKVEAFLLSPADHPLIRFSGAPTVVMTSGEEWVVTQGSPGCDLEVIYQRSAIAACDREIALAKTTDDVNIWKKRRMEADVAERKGMRDRTDQLEYAAAAGLVALPPRDVEVPVTTIAVQGESFGSKFRKVMGL